MIARIQDEIDYFFRFELFKGAGAVQQPPKEASFLR